MTAGDLCDHSADHVVQVETGLHVREQGLVLCLDGLPVASVHVLEIVTVAESAPHLVVDLGPFLGVVDGCVHVVSVDVLSAGTDLGRREIDYRHLAPAVKDGLLVAEAVRDHPFGAVVDLAGSEIICPDCSAAPCTGTGCTATHGAGGSAGEPDLLAVAEESTASVERKFHHPVDKAFRVDLDGDGLVRSSLSCLRALAGTSGRHVTPSGSSLGAGSAGAVLGSFVFFLGRSGLAVGRKQRGRRILGEHHHVGPGHVAVGIVPFDAAVDRIEVTV